MIIVFILNYFSTTFGAIVALSFLNIPCNRFALLFQLFFAVVSHSFPFRFWLWRYCLAITRQASLRQLVELLLCWLFILSVIVWRCVLLCNAPLNRRISCNGRRLQDSICLGVYLLDNAKNSLIVKIKINMVASFEHLFSLSMLWFPCARHMRPCFRKLRRRVKDICLHIRQ